MHRGCNRSERCVYILIFLCLTAATRSGQASKTSDDERAKISTLNDQALALEGRGNFKDALPIAQQCLSRAEKALGPNDPDTATMINNLAFAYHHGGNFAKAEQLYAKALSMREKLLGPQHLEVAATLQLPEDPLEWQRRARGEWE
jgi:tetratricopeptide (TPR) repeat protein